MRSGGKPLIDTNRHQWERGNRSRIVGAPKAELRRYEAQLLDNDNWTEVEAGLEARLVPHPDGAGEERYVLCRSSARRAKEEAMLERQMTLLAPNCWMQSKGLGNSARKLVTTISTIRSMYVVVPVKRGETKLDLRLRTVAKPDEDVAVLLAHLGLRLLARSRIIENVVEKNAP